jgi:hypothetical protein
MPTLTRAKQKQKTRHHSNLRPKHKHTRDFLKVYYPYLPLVAVTLLILSILQPWQALVMRGQDILPYATQMSIDGLVQETNERRTAQQQSALQLNAKLTKAAQIKAQDMVERNYWSHNTPEGNAPWEFVNNAGYSYAKAGENLAYGFSDEDDVVAGWMNSPGHRANMLDANYREVGFGFAESKDYVEGGPSTVVVAMYGQPSGAAEATSSDPVTQGGAVAYNTLGLAAEPADTGINRIQAFANAPAWVNYVIAGLVGGLIVFLLFKHGRALKRTAKNGQKFALKHPLLDVTIISVIILGILISQQTGIIR